MKLIFVLLVVIATSTNAAINAVEFDTPEQSERYKKLIDELRCLVCQNQNLADSDADLAVDLKNIVQQKINAGESDAQILDFMTERYGDFVLYRPPFKSNTLLLWLGPSVFLMFGLLIVVGYIKRSNNQRFSPSEEQREQVRRMLNSEDLDNNVEQKKVD